ncbi:MAG: 3'-5' exonuclease [Methylotenera sp.]|nr:3'-5' exonuclease [Methylotenera sp.]MDP1959082.1 3'-5' exonuclease [Methylotenera sp.]MDP3206584.1 3'-5' exonuclease [Methylotenera sp.]MDP3303988.1 3'-5' exonuclease [Methylotenera sp.]MDP3942432.1 3'-5' exonuclease [Methylotenera sp.]
MTPTLVFDIETIPDTDGLRKLLDLPLELCAEDVANIALHQRRQHNGSDFLPLHQHRICAISCALREGENFKVWTLGDADSSEAEIIQRFFDGIEKYTPQIISWNGGGFDLPVLHYRGLIHGINASRYWDLGEDDKEFKWNNYISRYHTRHLDLMDVMAMFNARANAPLDDLAKLCGFPGKLGMDGSKVWDAYKAGGIEDIRNYCETDVANTHLVFLRFQLMRGHLTPAAYEAEINLVRDTLTNYEAPHWSEFLAAWRTL